MRPLEVARAAPRAFAGDGEAAFRIDAAGPAGSDALDRRRAPEPRQGLEVQCQFGPGAGLVHVLATRSTAAREPRAQESRRHQGATRNVERTQAGHAEQGRLPPRDRLVPTGQQAFRGTDGRRRPRSRRARRPLLRAVGTEWRRQDDHLADDLRGHGTECRPHRGLRRRRHPPPSPRAIPVGCDAAGERADRGTLRRATISRSSADTTGSGMRRFVRASRSCSISSSCGPTRICRSVRSPVATNGGSRSRCR